MAHHFVNFSTLYASGSQFLVLLQERAKITSVWAPARPNRVSPNRYSMDTGYLTTEYLLHFLMDTFCSGFILLKSFIMLLNNTKYEVINEMLTNCNKERCSDDELLLLLSKIINLNPLSNFSSIVVSCYNY